MFQGSRLATQFRPTVLLLVLSIALVAGGLATAQDSPRVIDNPAQPKDGVQTLKPVEMWRIGGEDDDVFFGNVGALRAGKNGELYVLDSQLSETHVYSADGEFLRTIGGEGDGPGEVRRPGGMFLAPDGTVCVLQGFPGKIVMIAPDGTPAGETKHSMEGDSGGQFNVIINGQGHIDGMALLGIRMNFVGPGEADNIYFLDICDPTGKRVANLAENSVKLNFAAPIMNEGEADFPVGRYAVGADGRVYVGIPRNEYEITVFSRTGVAEQVIKRPFESLQRSDEQTEIARRIQAAIGANYPSPPKEIIVEDTQADIGQMMIAPNGNLWVQTSRMDLDLPAGTWISFDVFAADGTFLKQVALQGDHDAQQDWFVLLDDGRACVVTGSLDAWLNQMGAIEEEADADSESEPLQVICYRLDG